MISQMTTIKRNGYNAIYHELYDENAELYSSQLVRYVLHPSYCVWRIGATYAPSLSPSFYYAIARCKTEAVRKFKRRLPWLNHIKIAMPASHTLAEQVLSNPAHFIVF